jgi:DinB superfamily
MSVIEAYLAGPRDLRLTIDGLSREQLRSRSVPGMWSILEVGCHLADTDANIAHRINCVLSEERPTFERVRPDLMQAALAYHAREAEEELTAFRVTRLQIGRILSASPPEAWERTVD